jgi:hypothetical protein
MLRKYIATTTSRLGIGWQDYSENVDFTDGNVEPSRSAHVAETLKQLRRNDTFDILMKWRGDLKPEYGPTGELLFSIE